MEAVSGVGSRVHLRPEDDESTRAIVERGTKVTVRGDEATWRELKKEQQGHVGAIGAVHLGHAALEGFEGMEVLFGGGTIAGLAGGAIAVGGLALGLYEMHEAHEKADAQKAALAKDAAHVAIIANLELPESYASKRLGSDFKHVGKEAGSPAFRMTETIKADARGRALLQLHADRGMNAARDCAESGQSREAFSKLNPAVERACVEDAAFREGFEGYLWVHRHGSREEKAQVDRDLLARDAWYAADHVAIRM